VPLRRDTADPKCRGAKTACFVDPCRAKRAVCRKGGCAIIDEPARIWGSRQPARRQPNPKGSCGAAQPPHSTPLFAG
jgi:hypothetical protein